MIGQFRVDVIGRLSVKLCMLLAIKTRNVIGAFLSVYCHSLTVVYCQSNCALSTAMYWERKTKREIKKQYKTASANKENKNKIF